MTRVSGAGICNPWFASAALIGLDYYFMHLKVKVKGIKRFVRERGLKSNTQSKKQRIFIIRPKKYLLMRFKFIYNGIIRNIKKNILQMCACQPGMFSLGSKKLYIFIKTSRKYLLIWLPVMKIPLELVDRVLAFP